MFLSESIWKNIDRTIKLMELNKKVREKARAPFQIDKEVEKLQKPEVTAEQRSHEHAF